MTDKSASVRILLLSVLLLGSIGTLGQNCKSGDCQQSTIGGPYTAAQKAEYTAPNFPVCNSSACTTGNWGAGVNGIAAEQNIGSQYQFYDPAYNLDANIAVGPTVQEQNAQVLEWINFGYVQAFDKVTGKPIFSFNGGSTAVPQSVINLWSSSTQPECAQNGSGNVEVIYDRMDGEFVISRHVEYQVSGIPHYAWCMAASSGSDLSSADTAWYTYEYVMDTVIPCLPNSANCTTGSNYYYFPDWPRIGTWSGGFYITFDLADPTRSYLQIGFEACQFDRANITQGKPSNPITCNTYMVPNSQLPSLIHSVDVGDVDSAAAPPRGEPEYFLSIVNPSNAQQGQNGHNRCTSQTTPCTSNQLAVFTWGPSGLTGPKFINVDPYTPGCYDTSSGGAQVNTVCVPEPSTIWHDINGYGKRSCFWFKTPCLDSLGDRMANRLAYNKLSSSGNGPNGEFLTTSHVVMESATKGRTGIRYYILRISNGTPSVLVNSGGKSAPPDLQDPNKTLFYFLPSAALDKNGNLGITYTSSGKECATCQTQPHPALNFATLPWMGNTFLPSTTIIQGKADQQNSNNWGEYAATVLDSTDGLTFYGVGEFFNLSQRGTGCGPPPNRCFTWKTRIFHQRFK
jgi:hypothetical protein